MNILVLFQQKVVKPVQTTSKKLANNYLVAYERNLPINIWCLYTAGMWESRNQTVWGPAQKNMSALVHKNLWLLWCWDTLLEILVYTFLGRLSHGNGARARSASCHPQKQLRHPRFLSSVLQMRLWRSEEGPPTSLSQSPSAGANKNVCMYINMFFYISIYLSIYHHQSDLRTWVMKWSLQLTSRLGSSTEGQIWSIELRRASATGQDKPGEPGEVDWKSE